LRGFFFDLFFFFLYSDIFILNLLYPNLSNN